MKRYIFALLFAVLLTSGCAKSEPTPPPVPPPVVVVPPPKPIPPPPPGHRALSFFHFGIGIADAAAHPVDYPSMGVAPILVCANEFWSSPSAQLGLDDLCARARAAVQSGPLGIAIRAYSQNGADDNLWTTDPARWSALVQRAKWLSTACAAHDIAGVWVDAEWDPAGTFAGRPVMPYPGANAKDAWYLQAWQQSPGVDMAARGAAFAAALLSAKPDLTLGIYAPIGGLLKEGWKGTPHPPPGWLPFARSYFAAASSKGIIFEDFMLPSAHAAQMAGYLATELPGVPSYGGVNFSWQAASGAKLPGVVALACRAPSQGAAFFSMYRGWDSGLSDPATRAKIRANLAALGGL